MHECTRDENAVLGFNSGRERASADLRWAVARVQLTRKRTGSVFFTVSTMMVTFAAMRERRPGLEIIEVQEQGHAPLLSEAPLMAQLAAFIARCDRPQ